MVREISPNTPGSRGVGHLYPHSRGLHHQLDLSSTYSSTNDIINATTLNSVPKVSDWYLCVKCALQAGAEVLYRFANRVKTGIACITDEIHCQGFCNDKNVVTGPSPLLSAAARFAVFAKLCLEMILPQGHIDLALPIPQSAKRQSGVHQFGYILVF